MKSLTVLLALLFFAAGIAQGQTSGSSSPSSADAANAAQTSSGTAGEPADKSKKKKKVWTNDEISSVGGPGSISVVGKDHDSGSGNSTVESSDRSGRNGTTAMRQKQIATYRDRLRQLNNQLETTDKQISELRNFKANNTGASGGINMSHRYSMTPVEEQVKNLEEKKKQIQAQISALEDQARKEGVEPGQLR